jgi:hypothetical protein
LYGLFKADVENTDSSKEKITGAKPKFLEIIHCTCSVGFLKRYCHFEYMMKHFHSHFIPKAGQALSSAVCYCPQH